MPTFDGDSLIITLDSGVTILGAEVDLYNAWKDWQLAGNMRFPQAFRTIGGDNLTSGVDAGAYFFIQNNLGWRIRPPEEDITILLTGNLSPEDSSLPILIPTAGAYTVLVQGIQPITQNIDTIKTSLEYSTFNGGIYWDAVSGKSSITNSDTDGNEANPLLNLSDVVTQAAAKSFSRIHVVANATVGATPSMDNYQLMGKNRSQTTIAFSSADTGDMSIELCNFSGALNGALHAANCTVGTVTGIGCTVNSIVFHDCGFNGNVTLRSDNNQPVDFLECGSVEGVQMVLDVNGTSGDITIQGYSDRIKIINMTTAINLHVSSAAGCELEVDASCTAVNLFEVHGNVNIVNNSALTIDDDATHNLVWTVPDGAFVKKILRNKRITDQVTGITTVYDDDNSTIIYQGNIWENAGGTDPYSGAVINRQDRFEAP